VSTATTGVELLTTSDPAGAQCLARTLNEENSKRQQIEKTITAEAKAMLKGEQDPCKPLVLASSRWHQGVIGICASRLVEEFYRPTILISIDEAAEQEGVQRGAYTALICIARLNNVQLCLRLLAGTGMPQDLPYRWKISRPLSSSWQQL